MHWIGQPAHAFGLQANHCALERACRHPTVEEKQWKPEATGTSTLTRQPLGRGVSARLG